MKRRESKDMQQTYPMRSTGVVGEKAARIVIQVVLLLGAMIMVLPFLWMLVTSVKLPPEILIYPPTFIPRQPTLSNFVTVFQTAPFPHYFLNSLIVALVSTSSVLITSMLAGYIFAKFKFPLDNVLFILILATAMVPLETYMIPLYLQMKTLHLINTYPGLVAPDLIMAYGIFFMRQNCMASLPDELLDAARIDGASEWRIFGSIVVPLLTSAMGALAIFAFINCWSEFIWPLLITSTKELWTMELGLGIFQQKFTIDYGPITAGAMISILPILTAFLILRRRIIYWRDADWNERVR